MPEGPSENIVPTMIVQFCGGHCWKKQKGGNNEETMRELLEGQADMPERGKSVETVQNGRTVILQRMHGCIGGCSRGPAARIILEGSENLYLRADSAEAVREAMRAADEES